MKIEGKLHQTLPVVSGETDRGMWVRGGFVIETFGDYPKKMAFTTFGEERVKMASGIALGQPIEVNFSIESREFNDKWYTELRATSVKPMAGAVVAQPAAPAPQPAPQAAQPPVQFPANFTGAPAPVMPEQKDDDLPF